MDWLGAEDAIRARIESQWPLTAFAAMPLTWDNENIDWGDRYMAVNIEGNFADKTIIGGVGKRSSVEYGMVYFHAFVPSGSGKRAALGAVIAMAEILELQTIDQFVTFEGASPPSPIEPAAARDPALPATGQPGGNFWRCSGSVPFCLVGTR